MISEIKMKITDNKVKSEIIVEGGHKPGDLFLFYLIKNANVICKTDWVKENTFSFVLQESGTYFIQGYLKRNGKKELMRSLPHEYISISDYNEYQKFLESKPLETSLNTPLKYDKLQRPNQDWILVSSTDIKKIKKTDLIVDEVALKPYEIQSIGKWHNILYADKVKSGQDFLFCFSGSTMINKMIVHGYDKIYNIKGSELDIENENGIGIFSYVIAKKEYIKIHNDFFNFQPVFCYKDKDIYIFTNRYHLLLIALKNIGHIGVIDTNKAILSLSNYNVVFMQNISKKMDIIGCQQVDNRYQIVLNEKGWQFILDEYGKIVTEPYSNLSDQEIQNAFNHGKNEILMQIESLFNNKGIGKIIVDLSGGLDSRMIYAAFTNFKIARDKIMINSKDVGNDLSIALKINELYNYKFDDTKSVLKKATKNDRYMFARSKYMGTYYAHQGVAAREFSGDIRCVGACGETTYRKMFARAINKNRQVDNEDILNFVNNMYDWCMSSQYGDGDKIYDKFCNHFINELVDTSGINFEEKLDRFYLELRHSHHFSNINSAIRVWYPLQSKSMFKLHHSIFGNINNIEIALRLINDLNPILLKIPFESKDDNDDYARLQDSLRSDNFIENLSIDFNEIDRTTWMKANERKRGKKNILTPDEGTDQNNDIFYDACIYNLNKLLKRFPEIEDAIGASLYLQLKQFNISNKKNLAYLFNKITSLVDQSEIFEDNVPMTFTEANH